MMDQLENKVSGSSAGAECVSTTVQSYSELTVEEDPPLLDFNRYETLDESDFEEEKGDTFAEDGKEKVRPNLSIGAENSCLGKNIADLENSKATWFEKGNNNACKIQEEEGGEQDDIEDGEIEERTDSESLNKYSCRFFRRGRCAWGRECRYLHISDKGLYSMLDVSDETSKTGPPISFRSEVNYIFHPSFPPEQKYESFWDRALNEAKERVMKSKLKKEHCLKERLYMTIHSDDKTVHANSPQQMSPVRHDISKPDTTKKGKACKASYYSEWRDPWRRSKSPRRRKRSSESSNSTSSCSRPSSRDCRSPILKRLRRRSLSDRSSSSSSCSCLGSTSCSDSSSDISSRKLGSHRAPSYSPTYSKTKDRLSSEKTKKIRSISRPVPIQKLSTKCISKKKTIVLVKKRNNRSRSSLSSRFCKTNDCNRSCSDMSISPLSDSFASCKSKYASKSKVPSLEKLKSSQNTKANSIQSRVHISDKDSNTNYVSPAVIGKTLNTKMANSLEMELWKYRGFANVKASKQVVKPLPNLISNDGCTDATLATGSKSTSKSTVAKKLNHTSNNKRNMLMKQLKAIEEAIARKKTSFHLTS